MKLQFPPFCLVLVLTDLCIMKCPLPSGQVYSVLPCVKAKQGEPVFTFWAQGTRNKLPEYLCVTQISLQQLFILLIIFPSFSYFIIYLLFLWLIYILNVSMFMSHFYCFSLIVSHLKHLDLIALFLLSFKCIFMSSSHLTFDIIIRHASHLSDPLHLHCFCNLISCNQLLPVRQLAVIV